MEAKQGTAPNATSRAVNDLLVGIGSWDCDISDPKNLRHPPLSTEASSDDPLALSGNGNCPFHLATIYKEATQDAQVGNWNALATWLSENYPHELYLVEHGDRQDTRNPAMMEHTSTDGDGLLGLQRPNGNEVPVSELFPVFAERSGLFVDDEDAENGENPQGFFREAYLCSSLSTYTGGVLAPEGESLCLADYHRIELPIQFDPADTPRINPTTCGPVQSPLPENTGELRGDINVRWPDIARELLNLPDLPEQIHSNVDEPCRYGVRREASMVLEAGIHILPKVTLTSTQSTNPATEQYNRFPSAGITGQESLETIDVLEEPESLSASTVLVPEAVVAAESRIPRAGDIQVLNTHESQPEPYTKALGTLARPDPVAPAGSPSVWAGAAVSGMGAYLAPQPRSLNHPAVPPNSQVGARGLPNLETQMVETRKSWFPTYEPDGDVDIFSGRKRRPKLTEEKRRERGKVRENKACFRCRKLRIKCDTETTCKACGDIKPGIRKQLCIREYLSSKPFYFQGVMLTYDYSEDLKTLFQIPSAKVRMIRLRLTRAKEAPLLVLPVRQSYCSAIKWEWEEWVDEERPQITSFEMTQSGPCYTLADFKETWPLVKTWVQKLRPFCHAKMTAEPSIVSIMLKLADRYCTRKLPGIELIQTAVDLWSVSYITDGVGFSMADERDDAVDKSEYGDSMYRSCNIVNPALQMQLRTMINSYGRELEKTTLKEIEKMSLRPDKKKRLWLPIFISLFVLFETAEWDLYEG
ncbi:hypothetical protein GP486_003426, partial [Trichoglossum hirsutum]